MYAYKAFLALQYYKAINMVEVHSVLFMSDG